MKWAFFDIKTQNARDNAYQNQDCLKIPKQRSIRIFSAKKQNIPLPYGMKF